MLVNPRKLAAIDLHFLGPKLIVSEFALGVAGPLALGALTLRMAWRQGWPPGLTVFGVYLVSIGMNYIPLLVHAVSLVRSGGAERKIAGELLDRPGAFRKYRRQSLFLLVPLVVPVAEIVRRKE